MRCSSGARAIGGRYGYSAARQTTRVFGGSGDEGSGDEGSGHADRASDSVDSGRGSGKGSGRDKCGRRGHGDVNSDHSSNGDAAGDSPLRNDIFVRAPVI